MSAQPDKKTVIKDLVEFGKGKGRLSTKEILDALGELDFDPEQIEKFYDTLESQGVEIVEDFDDMQLWSRPARLTSWRAARGFPLTTR